MKAEARREISKTVGKHLLGLFILVVVGPLPLYYAESTNVDQPHLVVYFLQALTGISIVLIPPVYTNAYYLIPKFLEKKRYLLYAIGSILIIAAWVPVAAYIEPWTDEHWFGLPAEDVLIQDGFFAILFVLIISTLMSLSYKWFIQLSRIKQVENDRLNIELSMLKNQINPHFFFNTLNNLYSLALEKADETPQVILKLSEMMRYTIYDCKESRVKIGSEISYLKNYIALQQIRQSAGANIKFEKDVVDSSIKIAPMVLIVFLENAFKHGMEIMLEDAYINIELKVTEEELHFRIENNFENSDNEDSGGLGLENVRRRLSLIYPETHTLLTEDVNGIFKIELSIELNKE